MGAPTASMRCPSCGTPLEAVLAPSAATQWFPCPNCHQPVPFVPPRLLPPLYSWEVVPGLYPAQRLPRRPRWQWRRVAGAALAVAAALAAVTAGFLGLAGFRASEPAHYVVSGTVWENHPGSPATRAAGALVVLRTDDNRTTLWTNTTANGAFAFPPVPSGGLEINVTHAGYGPTDVYSFASPGYSGGASGLTIYLYPGGPSNTTSVVLAPFPDLETFLSLVGGAAVLVGVVAIVAGIAAWTLRRPGGAVTGVLGSGAAIAFPVVVLMFSLDAAFPLVSALAGVAGGLGAFGLVLTAAELASSPSRPEPA
jgi:hypothetical protein